MNSEELKKLYNEVVMCHQKSPHHFEERADLDPMLASNPLCGDKFNLYIDSIGHKVNYAGFYGIGCALSKASTSILMQNIENQDIETVRNLCRDFLSATSGESDLEWEDPEIKMLVELKNHGGRMDCIRLSWKSLLEELEK
ncbi:iron-sulfur cluster assembly scaffold protein [Fulvivirga sedimenti]|uniref:Iron-sulfur cluster assembly scaffold protein n=1 Tax=Fulvivirga sedimenti TaxID=2879465 RepID=A0A9X1HJZ5_9BACT|nr:iron-sulfur cluster assembly scaffold protein [Fulvivirga sedimenti]MCA6073485.1 iron-sulfur cluster assembly scaffold protein [Fulvivirga sedimenti]